MMHLIRRALASIRARAGVVKRRRSEHVPGLVGRPEAYAFKQQFQITFLRSQGLLPRDSVLDYGCGVLRGGIPVIRYLDAGNYVGLDIRPEALRAAHKAVRRESLTNKKPTLVNGDQIDALNLGRHFDFIWAFSVFFHLADDHLDECLRFAARHLKPDGTLFANVGLGNREPGVWREFPVVWRTLEEYARRGRAVGLDVSPLGQLSQFGHHSPTDPEEDEQMMLAFKISPPA